MSGAITAAVVVASTTMYSADQANKSADARTAAANANNSAAAAESRKLAEVDAKARKDELLRRFGVSSSKLQDTSRDVLGGTSTKLTGLEMELAKASSVTDNALASRHITGRLADRMRAVTNIQGNMQKGTIIQDAEAQIKDIGNKLETMTTNMETDQMNLGIDLTNSINAANNQEVLNKQYSTSTGFAGVLAAGVSSGISAYGVTRK